MTTGSFFMGIAGLLASVVANSLSARYAHRQKSGQLLVQIRDAAKDLVSGTDLDYFASDYKKLLIALGQVAFVQCFAVLSLTVPTTCLYFLSAGCYDYFGSVPRVTPSAWSASHETVFTIAFFAGSVAAFIWRRL